MTIALTSSDIARIAAWLTELPDDDELFANQRSLTNTVHPVTGRLLDACVDAFVSELRRRGREPPTLNAQVFDAASYRLQLDRRTLSLRHVFPGDSGFDVAVVPRAEVARGTLRPQRASLRYGVWFSAKGQRDEILAYLRDRARPGFPPIDQSPTAAHAAVRFEILPEELHRVARDGSIESLVLRVGRQMADIYEAYAVTESRTNPQLTPATNPDDALAAVRLAFRARGLRYTDEEIAASYIALATKGFLILSGISGTGKTRLAQTWAEILLGPDSKSNSAFVSVRPDWRDSASLIGYPDLLRDRFAQGPLTRFLLGRARSARALVAPADHVSPDQVRQVRDGTKSIVAKARELALGGRIADAWSLVWDSPDADAVFSVRRSPTQLGKTGQEEWGRLLFDTKRRPADILLELLQVMCGPDQEARKPWHRVMRAFAFAHPELGLPAHRYMITRLSRAVGISPPLHLEDLMASHSANELERALLDLRERMKRQFLSSAGSVSDDPLLVVENAWRIYDEFGGDDDEPSSSDEGVPDAPKSGSPLFFFLDEMNLAHVEHYFADVLSVMESGFDPGTAARKERLRLHDLGDKLGVPEQIELPRTFYLVGTVNVDETTSAFSPKVLDRAFSLEIDDVDLRDYPGAIPSGDQSLPDATRTALLADFTREGEGSGVTKQLVSAAADVIGLNVIPRLQRLNRLLEPMGFHFGYRVVDEILAFVHLAARSPMLAGFRGATRDHRIESAFDTAVRMKVLPKFHGPTSRLEEPLRRVIVWCHSPDQATAVDAHTSEFDDSIRDAIVIRERADALRRGESVAAPHVTLPRTAAKALRMLAELHETGYAAFA